MSWSVAHVSSSTVWLVGLPEGARACVKICQAAMSDDSPQGNLSSAAMAGPAQAAMMAAKPNNQGNIFLSPAPKVRMRHGGFKIVLQIDLLANLRRGMARIYSFFSISRAIPHSWTSAAANIRAIFAYSQQSYGVERHLAAIEYGH